jgi:hypothetical protein
MLIMEFPNYHLYSAMITQRDQTILTLVILVMVAFEILLVVRRFRPGWTRGVTYLFIGGYYATLFALAVYLRSGN